MKLKFLLGSSFVLLTSIVQGGPVLVTGTPGDSYLSTPTSASPNLGGLKFNFDALTPFSTFSSTTYASQGITISSPDGLIVDPFSTQSGPNELFDNSSNGSADIMIEDSHGTAAIGIGIADSDITAAGAPVTIFLQALNSSDAGFGTLFSVTLPETGPNPGNGYFVIEDTTPDIFGIQITQPVGNSALYSGLAIDDLQIAPEPSSFLLLTGGAVLLGCFRRLKRG